MKLKVTLMILFLMAVFVPSGFAQGDPLCSAEIHVTGAGSRVVNPDRPLTANVLSMISSPTDCLPADLRITATYFGAGEAFVCNGTVTVSRPRFVQSTAVEFRPYELEVFLKWWDDATLKQESLVCLDYQGKEVRNPADRASTVRLYISVSPRRGGLATEELTIALVPAPKP